MGNQLNWGPIAADFHRSRGATISIRRLIAACFVEPGVIAVAIYRLQSSQHRKGHRRVAQVLRVWNNAITGADLLPGSDIGDGLLMRHPTGVVIGAGVQLGANCTILQNVTLGERRVSADSDHLYPTLGNRVSVGAGAVILGGITVGDDVVIGANSVVTTDLPSGCVAVGSPARAIVNRDRS